MPLVDPKLWSMDRGETVYSKQAARERALTLTCGRFFYVLNNEFDRAMKLSLTKRGYTHILNMNQSEAYGPIGLWNQLICCS